MKNKYVIKAMLLFTILLFTLPMAFLFVGRIALADSSACYNIANSDQRTFCIARANNDPSTCYTIKASDVRSQCLAEVRKK